MLSPGKVLQERYQLQEKLGQNASRQTWLALDLQDPRSQPVVVKMLTFGGDIQWKDLKLFETEAQILKQLNHSRIPKYKDYFSIDDRALWFGLIQEYIPGKSLKDLLAEKNRFTDAEIRKIAEEILEILIYLHSLNPRILHRDIKPSNLIFGEDGRVHLIDFGAVQDRSTPEGCTFTVVGTYGYAPIEQFGGRAVPASDLYALGATLIHLMTGVSPAELPTRDLRIQFRQKLDLENEEKVFLADWLEKLVEPAVEKRLTTAQQALDSLRLRIDVSIYPLSKRNELLKPSYSEIRIAKSLKALTIDIPMRGITNWQDTINLILILFSGFLSLGLAFNPLSLAILGGLWLWIISPFIKSIFAAKKITFTCQDFSIKNLVFAVIPFVDRGKTKNIRDISINYFTAHPIFKEESIIITTKSRNRINEKYYCAQGLTEDELIWLAQEMRNWLAWQDGD
jgi:serine/threonine protein kinase